MSSLLHSFDAGTLPVPESFPSPFDELGPHPLALRAAEALQADLRNGGVAFDPSQLQTSGKMFGVLVVQGPSGLAYLRAFSGMLEGAWTLPGFVPPIFDARARANLEPEGEKTVKALSARHESLLHSPELTSLRAETGRLTQQQQEVRAALKKKHEANRAERHAERARLDSQTPDPAALHALDQASRADKAELRRLTAAQDLERKELAARLSRLERRLRALERLRHFVCRRLMQQLHDTYRVTNARGTKRLLRELYTSGEPPSGAGDCAAPKLFSAAFTLGLRPIALAEFWWGAPPLAGGRLQGSYYPACREKCAPLLPFLLEGLPVSPPRKFRPESSKDRSLTVLYEDAWIVILDKPHGLLSVPGREVALKDSVLERLRARHPHARGPLLVHRLDLDTSGLLVAALEPDGWAALQRQFLRREIEKRYIAWVDGPVAKDSGTIDFPLRVDLNDRPRQIHDPLHGKHALTHFQVLERQETQTRVALFPHTGRTHQLRVHASHPLGLNAPIVGDRLYGRPGPRLMLHAERLVLTHPHTGERLSFERAAPF